MVEIDLIEQLEHDEQPQAEKPIVTESLREWVITLLETPCVSNREGHA